VSFGLVNVPVKLVTAQSAKDVRFNQLDGKDGTRIATKRVRPDTGEEVPYERLVKGYEVAPSRYVVIDPSELDALDPEASRTIDIEEFVSLDEIDPLYFEKGYYLIPGTGAEKAYALLARAMEKTNRVAIARFVMRTKQYLAALRAKDGALVLSTMLYADEVTTADRLELPDLDKMAPSEREVKMAEQLIESLSTEFDPTRYKDEHREKVLALIEAKSEGQEVVTSAAPEEPTKVVDLMAALEASLAAAKKARGNGPAESAAGGPSGPAERAAGGPSSPSERAKESKSA